MKSLSDAIAAHIAHSESPEGIAERVAWCTKQIRQISPFFIENWLPALRALSIQTEIIPLTPAHADTLIALINATWEGKSTHGIPTFALAGDLEPALATVGGRAFVRLGSRSPKDNTGFMQPDMRPAPVYSAHHAIEALSYSERVTDDLTMAMSAGYSPVIAVRRWVDMPPECEFRCFVSDSRISGITQYYLDGHGPSSWINRNAAGIEATLRRYLSDVLVPLSGYQSFTADLILTHDFRVTLLEVNPPVESGSTYPGLFGLNDLDGSFRYLPIAVPAPTC